MDKVKDYIDLFQTDLNKYLYESDEGCYEVKEVNRVVKEEIELLKSRIYDMFIQFNISTCTWLAKYYADMYNINFSYLGMSETTFEEKIDFLYMYANLLGGLTNDKLDSILKKYYDEPYEYRYESTIGPYDRVNQVLIIKFLGQKGIPSCVNILREVLEKLLPFYVKEVIFEYNFTIWNEVKDITFNDRLDITWNEIKTRE